MRAQKSDTVAAKAERSGALDLQNRTMTDLYWRDIRHSKPLSRKEEVRLFKLAKAGDEESRQTIITANLRFVVSVAREYKDYGMSLSELISEGNVGLLEATKRFDEDRGFKFITYAVWWIRQAILKALAEHGKMARPPMSQINDLHLFLRSPLEQEPIPSKIDTCRTTAGRNLLCRSFPQHRHLSADSAIPDGGDDRRLRPHRRAHDILGR